MFDWFIYRPPKILKLSVKLEANRQIIAIVKTCSIFFPSYIHYLYEPVKFDPTLAVFKVFVIFRVYCS